MRATSLLLGLLGWMAGCAERHPAASDDLDMDPGSAANGTSTAAEPNPQAHELDPSTAPASPDEPGASRPRAGHDAAVDAIVPIDAMPDAPFATTGAVSDEELACTQASGALADFLQKYNQCSTDADCVTLGSCGPYSFLGAPKNVSSTARSLHSAMLTQCGRRLGYDGQLQEAYCSGDRCSVRLVDRYCGQATVPPPQPPGCDVTIKLEVTRGERSDGFNLVPYTNLSLQAGNNTDTTKRIVLPAPCSGAYVFEGLNGYTPTPDANCLFGVCPRDTTQTVDVPTNGIVELARYSLTPPSILCGQNLPKGEYDVTLQPLTITGASTCVTTTVHLSMP
jgi:hypothetical protein